MKRAKLNGTNKMLSQCQTSFTNQKWNTSHSNDPVEMAQIEISSLSGDGAICRETGT